MQRNKWMEKIEKITIISLGDHDQFTIVKNDLDHDRWLTVADL